MGANRIWDKLGHVSQLAIIGAKTCTFNYCETYFSVHLFFVFVKVPLEKRIYCNPSPECTFTRYSCGWLLHFVWVFVQMLFPQRNWILPFYAEAQLPLLSVLLPCFSLLENHSHYLSYNMYLFIYHLYS